MVCKTIRDGSNPSVHLRSGVMVSTQDFGSCDIGSNPMAAASHSSNRTGQGTSNPLMWVQILHETSGYVAKRLCTGLLTRDTQVRLLSYPSVITRKSYPCFEKLPYLIKMIVFCKSKQSQYQIYSVLICIIQVCSLYFEFQIGLFKRHFSGFFQH